MLRRPYAVILLALGAASCRARLGPHNVLLANSEIPVTQRPCSRPGPSNITGVWRPSRADVLRADSLVRVELGFQLDSLRWLTGRPDSLRPHAADYDLQYVPILINGQRVLYVNGLFHVVLDNRRDRSAWRHHYIDVCDGWYNFFGAEVWLDQNKVHSFAFNGVG